MAQDTLEAYEALHYDLEALRDIDRLAAELETHRPCFRALLAHPRKNDTSRKALQTESKLSIDDTIYEVNDDFRNSALQLADELDSDELECAKLLLEAQKDAGELDRSPVVSAIMRFHRRRQYLLECLRMAFFASVEGGDFDEQPEDPEDEGHAADTHRARLQSVLGKFKDLVLVPDRSSSSSATSYFDKCMQALTELEEGLQRVASRAQRASVVGQSLSHDEEQIMAFERETLTVQHESLACIMTFVISQGRISLPACFREVVDRLKRLDKHDVIMLHLLPIAMACTSHFGSASSSCTESEINSLHESIVNQGDMDKWRMHNLYRAFRSWWIVEYAGRLNDDASSRADSTETDATLLLGCLKEGGLQFMLSIAQDVRRNDWHDPAKLQLTTFLLRGNAVLPQDAPKAAPHFQELLMDLFQSFIDAFISNMPDALRQLKFDEDDQRKLLRSRYQNNTAEYSYDLDRFLTIIAYAYQDSPEAAKSFWVDKDSNLYGFLQWAARRQTTPRAAAFCEMLRSLSEGEQCADSTHAFLLEEGAPIAGKVRRGASLSWSQIFAELDFYAGQSKDRQTSSMAQIEPQFEPGQSVEPESGIMLECYLRLITHLCAGSEKARLWLLSMDNPSLPNLLFQLLSSSNDGRVRSWCWMTLASLLTSKDIAINDAMWDKLDQWITSGATTNPGVARPERSMLDILTAGFEESNAFVHLLYALMVPSTSTAGLNDQLPFPENLGSPHRLPGVSSYVDFVLGKAFSEKTKSLNDAHHLDLLRLNCLDFIYTALHNFKEDLVIVANLSTDNHDLSIRTTSLETYVMLHPFYRVMEWLHAESCLEALFAAATQDVESINQALSDSPLVLSLVRAIEVMNLLMQLQPMYFDVVRPFRARRNAADKPVSQSIIPSFEDAVLKHSYLILNLGLYCGLGHSELTLSALSLLEKLSSSRKLSAPTGHGSHDSKDRNKLITVLQQNNDVLRISHTLSSALTIDGREIEAGPLASGFSIKAGILNFLRSTLKANPQRHNIAYLMLGFSYKSSQLMIEDVDGFSRGQCLFFSIARLAIDYPDSDHSTFLSWASSIKQASIDILKMLWRAPLSRNLIMAQLRDSDYGYLQSMKQRQIGPDSLWDNCTIDDPSLLITGSARALCDFLHQRTAYFDYFAREMRAARAAGSSSQLHRLQASLLGSTNMPGSPAIATPNLFDLFDFMELQLITICPTFAESEYYKETLFDICIEKNTEHGPVFDIARAEEIILLRKKAVSVQQSTDIVLRDSTRGDDSERSALDDASSDALFSLIAKNQWRELMDAHQETLRLWIRLVVIMVEDCALDSSIRNAFVQQAYQTLVPKFEQSISSSTSVAFELASLFLVLLSKPAPTTVPKNSSNGQETTLRTSRPLTANSTRTQTEVIHDSEHQVFQSALGAITSPSTTLELRQLCYQICNRYLRRLLLMVVESASLKRNVLRSVKLINDRLIETICDDAYASQSRNGVGALLLLQALASLTVRNAPQLIVDSLDRLNFVSVLVDSIRHIPANIQTVSASDFSSLLDYYHACLALLLQLAQTRGGAVAVSNAGLMSAIRDSSIFSTDPDVGFELDNPAALQNFFDLMLAVLRIVNSIVLKNQSEQMLAGVRKFISQNRTSMVGVLKRYAAIGGVVVHQSIDLSDLVDNWIVLLSATNYLEIDESLQAQQRPRIGIFS